MEIFQIKYKENEIPYTDAVPTSSMVLEVLKQIAIIWDNVDRQAEVLKMGM